ncbi:WGxxGxxG family protein [Deinococcus navajonensis]|uniref:WGxxGxxG family protein n=1 Tax=Deinococcus navajonensis TaxID=309884 RepID=A0ABV8XL16_9DEIO
MTKALKLLALTAALALPVTALAQDTSTTTTETTTTSNEGATDGATDWGWLGLAGLLGLGGLAGRRYVETSTNTVRR